MSRSSRGLGHRPFTAATGVRIPYGMPKLFFFIVVALQLALYFLLLVDFRLHGRRFYVLIGIQMLCSVVMGPFMRTIEVFFVEGGNNLMLCRYSLSTCKKIRTRYKLQRKLVQLFLSVPRKQVIDYESKCWYLASHRVSNRATCCFVDFWQSVGTS